MPKCGEYEIIREGEEIIVRIDCEECTFIPSIEDEPKAMSIAMDALAEAGNATKLLFVQKRDYEYDYNQTQILVEIAKLYKDFLKHKMAHALLSTPACSRFINPRYMELHNTIYSIMKEDPIGAYVTLKRIARREHSVIEGGFIQK
ncbi:MAG: hypothetical protein QW666_00890, partial [Candidatus Woesearchaeota archaeon]